MNHAVGVVSRRMHSAVNNVAANIVAKASFVEQDLAIGVDLN